MPQLNQVPVQMWKVGLTSEAGHHPPVPTALVNAMWKRKSRKGRLSGLLSLGAAKQKGRQLLLLFQAVCLSLDLAAGLLGCIFPFATSVCPAGAGVSPFVSSCVQEFKSLINFWVLLGETEASIVMLSTVVLQCPAAAFCASPQSRQWKGGQRG